MGYVSYESGRFFEQMPEARGPLPLQEFGLRRYEGSMVFEEGRWWIAGTESFQEEACELLMEAGKHLNLPQSVWVNNHEPPQQQFLEAVEEVLARISRGDCYQVNVARCLKFRPAPALLPLFVRLRERHPSQFGALLLFDGAGVVSNSPELFLRVDDEVVETVPIKGTRPRTPGAREQLRSSEKERAELTMIVDMARNDLARCCRAGSVVAEVRELVELPSLFHAQQRVRGRLRQCCDAVDAFAACFPPASVTGAPKVKAMEVIRELEPVPRGVYTGAIGYFSDDGNACFSVAIRTLMVCSGQAWLHVGSGIVADSNPEEELAESGWKAAAFVEALLGNAAG
jgi:anthranilate/para-aminobenzoate synthase component I